VEKNSVSIKKQRELFAEIAVFVNKITILLLLLKYSI